MTAEIHTLQLVHAGDGLHIEADKILNAALGKYIAVVLVGVDEEDALHVHGTDGAAQTNWLLDLAKGVLINGQDT